MCRVGLANVTEISHLGYLNIVIIHRRHIAQMFCALSSSYSRQPGLHTRCYASSVPIPGADPRPRVFARIQKGPQRSWGFIALPTGQYGHSNRLLELWNDRYAVCRVMYSQAHAQQEIYQLNERQIAYRASMESFIRTGMKMQGPNLYAVFDMNRGATALAICTVWKPDLVESIEVQGPKFSKLLLPDTTCYNKLRNELSNMIGLQQPLDVFDCPNSTALKDFHVRV